MVRCREDVAKAVLCRIHNNHKGVVFPGSRSCMLYHVGNDRLLLSLLLRVVWILELVVVDVSRFTLHRSGEGIPQSVRFLVDPPVPGDKTRRTG